MAASVATAAGLCTSGIIAVRTGGAGRGGEGARGTITGTGGNAVGSMTASRNTPIDRVPGVSVFSDA